MRRVLIISLVIMIYCLKATLYSAEDAGIGYSEAASQLFYEGFEGSTVNQPPSGWTFHSTWGDSGLTRVVDSPVSVGAKSLRVQGQLYFCQGVYKSGTVFQEDTKVSFNIYVPAGNTAGQEPGYFIYEGIAITFLSNGGTSIEARINHQADFAITGLSTDTWYVFELEIDWDSSKCRLMQGSNSTDIYSFTPNTGGGWASDVSLYGNNSSVTNTVYFDEISIDTASHNFDALFYDGFEDSTVNQPPNGWTFNPSWGDNGLIRVVSNPVSVGDQAVRVKGQSGWCQGVYYSGTVFQQDTTVTFHVNVPAGNSSGQAPGYFTYEGIAIHFFSSGGSLFEARINGKTDFVISGLSTDTWYTFTLEIDWDFFTCRLRQGTGATDIFSFTPLTGGGWASDVSLYGNNSSVTNTIYIDEITIVAADHSFSCTPPEISTDLNNQTICSGQTAELSVMATGTGPLSYQWYRGNSGDTSTPVGTNSNSFTTPSLTSTVTYWVRVSNGCGSDDSATAAITVNQSPSITAHPQSQPVCAGSTALMSVSASGTTPLNHQWYQGTAGNTSTPVGTNSNSFTTPTLSSTTSYWVRVSNSCGSDDSNTATITVNQGPSISAQPQAKTICEGDTATLSVSASGTTPLNYQWYQGTAGNTSTPVGTNSNSFTTPTLSSTTSYWVRVSNSCGSDDSNTATITVNQGPSISAQPQAKTICEGHTATLSVSASGTTPLSYQWYQGTAGNTSTPVGTNRNSFTTPSLTSTTNYWVRVSNSCGSDDSNTATVTVLEAPAISQQPQSQQINEGETATLSVTATGSSLQYQWYVGQSGDTSDAITAATQSSFTTPNLTETTSYWVRVRNNCGTEYSTTATVTVVEDCEEPQITTQPTSQEIPSGETAPLSVTATGSPPLNYQWYQGTSGNTSNPVGTNSSSYSTPPLTTTTSYWVQVSNACGTADSTTATITVMTDLGLPQAIYFPRIMEDDTWNTRLGVTNPHDKTVEVILEAYNSDGTVLATLLQSSVPAYGKIYDTVAHLFPSVAKDLSDIAWVKVSSSASVHGFAEYTTNDGLRKMLAEAVMEPSGKLYIPHIAAEQPDLWWSEAGLVSTEDYTSISFKSGEGGSYAVPGLTEANQQSVLDLNGYFSGDVESPACVGEFVSSQNNLCGVLMFGTKNDFDMAAALTLKSTPTRTLYYTHVAQDAIWWTGFTVFNPHSVAVTIDVYGYDELGELLGTSQVEIGAKSKMVGYANNFIDLNPAPAYVVMEAGKPVIGFELFGGNADEIMAGYNTDGVASKDLFFSHVRHGDDDWTGVSLINFGEAPANVTAYGYDEAGQEVAQYDFSLLEGEKFVRYVTDFFGGVDVGSVAHIRVESDQPLAGFELIGQGLTVLAAMPAVPSAYEAEEEIITDQGGTVAVGGATVDFPADAVSSSTAVTFSEKPIDYRSDGETELFGNVSYALEPEGMQTAEAFEIRIPVTSSMKQSMKEAKTTLSQLTIYQWNRQLSIWEGIPTTSTKSENLVGTSGTLAPVAVGLETESNSSQITMSFDYSGVNLTTEKGWLIIKRPPQFGIIDLSGSSQEIYNEKYLPYMQNAANGIVNDELFPLGSSSTIDFAHIDLDDNYVIDDQDHVLMSSRGKSLWCFFVPTNQNLPENIQSACSASNQIALWTVNITEDEYENQTHKKFHVKILNSVNQDTHALGYFGGKTHYNTISIDDPQVSQLNPLLLVHGINGTAGYWEDNIHKLRDDGFTAYAVYHMGIEDIPTSADMVGAAIDYVRSQQSNQEVDIVTHSYGGVITRWYCLDPENEGYGAANKIDDLVMIAPPHHGSLAAAKCAEGNSVVLFERININRTQDPYLPIYIDLTPGSANLMKMGNKAFPEGINQPLVLAGVKTYAAGLYTLVHEEGYEFSDGVVSVSSASLLNSERDDKSIEPVQMGVIRYNHTGQPVSAELFDAIELWLNQHTIQDSVIQYFFEDMTDILNYSSYASWFRPYQSSLIVDSKSDSTVLNVSIEPAPGWNPDWSSMNLTESLFLNVFYTRDPGRGFSIYHEDQGGNPQAWRACDVILYKNNGSESVEEDVDLNALCTNIFTPEAADPPVINSFTADPATIMEGNSSTLSWNVDNADTLTINRGVGDVTGLTSIQVTPGQTTTYTLTATNSAGTDTDTATVTVSAYEPIIQLSTSTLTNSCNEGENAPQKTFTVSNSGNGTLNYSITDNVTWLSCSPSSGTSTGEADTDTIHVNFSSSGLGADTYTATITVSDPNATNDPQEIDVTLTVSGGGGAGELWGTDSIVGDLMFVPAGTFQQGQGPNDPCSYSDETPFTHTLTKNLAVMATEVTRGMWADLKGEQSSLPTDPTNTSYGSGMDNPVQSVTWHEAILFANLLSVEQGLTRCYYKDASFTTPVVNGNHTSGSFYCDWNANGYRLPSEGEWEYFCRAGTTTPFWVAEPNFTSCSGYCSAGGLPILESAAWFCANDNGRSEPVASKLANPWGLYDVHGNVWEWCWDWYGGYPGGTATDHRGASSGSDRVFRGGGWGGSAHYCRSAYRSGIYPDYRFSRFGFRLCRSVN